MRRGRIFIYLALIVVLIVGAVAVYLYLKSRNSQPTAVATQATAQVRYVEIVTAGQNIYPGAPITVDMLSSVQIPEDKLVEGELTNKTDLVNKYARIQIAQGVIITTSMVSDTPGSVNLPGSSWAPFIPQGLTAIAIPMTRLSSVAFGIRDGDYVNIIVTMLLVDIDPSYQSILPNDTAVVVAPGPTSNGTTLSTGVTSGGAAAALGTTVTDQTLNQPFYTVPSEAQRPRMVTQMILQNVQVLHVGTFPLAGEADSLTTSSSTTNTNATPTPLANGTTTTTIVKPDIVTLMVSPQDAVTLTYLMFNGAQITFTLRNPNDQKSTQQPDAANLEYLLTQYNIPIPAKLPYSVQPRIDTLVAPRLPNDATPLP